MYTEPRIRAYDVGLLTKEYFMETQKALLKNPKAENIHFLINAHHYTVKHNDNPRDYYLRYELTLKVCLTDMRDLYNDPDLYTATVLTKLYDQLKTQIVIH